MSAVSPTRKFPMFWYWVTLLLIFVIANLPFAPTAYAGWLASANGCVLTGGAPTPCMIDGIDRGRDLQELSYVALYVFLTWPLASVLFIIWLVVLLGHRGRWKKKWAYVS